MKIVLGKQFRYLDAECFALDIPGVGIVTAHESDEHFPFEVITLRKEQLLLLKDEIDKELEDDKSRQIESNLE